MAKSLASLDAKGECARVIPYFCIAREVLSKAIQNLMQVICILLVLRMKMWHKHVIKLPFRLFTS